MYDKEHGGENQFSSNIDFFGINIYCLKNSNNMEGLVHFMKFDACDLTCLQIL